METRRGRLVPATVYLPEATHRLLAESAKEKGLSLSGHLLDRIGGRDIDVMRLQGQVREMEHRLAEAKALQERTDALLLHYNRVLGAQGLGVPG